MRLKRHKCDCCSAEFDEEAAGTAYIENISGLMFWKKAQDRALSGGDEPKGIGFAKDTSFCANCVEKHTLAELFRAVLKARRAAHPEHYPPA